MVLGMLWAACSPKPLTAYCQLEPAGAALGVGESSGSVEVVGVDREGLAVDHGHHGHGAAGGGEVDRFGGVG